MIKCVRVNVKLQDLSVESRWLPIIQLSTSEKWAIVESLVFEGQYHIIEVLTGMNFRSDKLFSTWDLEAAKAKLLELDSQ